MAITLVQTEKFGGTSVTPHALFSTTPIVGNLLIVAFAWNELNAGSVPVTTAPSGWTLIPGDGDVDNPGFVRQSSYYRIADGTETHTIGITLASSRPWAAIAAEYRGLTTSGVLDKHAQSHSTSTTASTGTTAVTSQAAQLWLAVVSNSIYGALQSGPSGGFTQVKEKIISGTPDGKGLTLDLYQFVANATAAATMTCSLSESAPYCGMIATFNVDAAAPKTIAAALTGRGSLTAQMFYPVLTTKVEAAFGSGPLVADPTWTNITSYTRSLSWKRGRQNELNRPETGTASLTLADPLSVFDSRNTTSPFYPNVKPGLQVRAWVGQGTVVYFLFRMVTEREPRTLRVASYTESTWSLVDAFDGFARAGLGGYAYDTELSGTRINNVLDDLGWPADLRDIDAGASIITTVTFDQNDSTTALQHLLDVADSENGLLFIDGQGRVVFVDRHSLISDAVHTTSTAVLSDV